MHPAPRVPFGSFNPDGAPALRIAATAESSFKLRRRWLRVKRILSSQLPGIAVQAQAVLLAGPNSGRKFIHNVSSATHIETHTMVSNMLVTGAQWVMKLRTARPPPSKSTLPIRVHVPSQNSGLRKTKNEIAKIAAAAKLV